MQGSALLEGCCAVPSAKSCSCFWVSLGAYGPHRSMWKYIEIAGKVSTDFHLLQDALLPATRRADDP